MDTDRILFKHHFITASTYMLGNRRWVRLELYRGDVIRHKLPLGIQLYYSPSRDHVVLRYSKGNGSFINRTMRTHMIHTGHDYVSRLRCFVKAVFEHTRGLVDYEVETRRIEKYDIVDGVDPLVSRCKTTGKLHYYSPFDTRIYYVASIGPSDGYYRASEQADKIRSRLLEHVVTKEDILKSVKINGVNYE